MTSLKQVYRCNICGNIVVVLHEGKGGERYVPVVEKIDKDVKVKVRVY